jgi:asparagine synthase (glutamine-hydrolysing)
VKNENTLWFRQKLSEAISVTEKIIKPDSLDYFNNMVLGKIRFDYTYWRLILFSDWIQKFQVKIQ